MKQSLAAGACLGMAALVLTASASAASVDWPTAKVTAKVMVLGLK